MYVCICISICPPFVTTTKGGMGRYPTSPSEGNLHYDLVE